MTGGDLDQIATTIGVEEEFHVLHPETGALAPAARRLLRDGDALDAEHELQRSMVETASAVCRDLDALRANLRDLRADLKTAADRLGLAIAAVGTVATSGTSTTSVYPHPRYEWMAQEYRQLVLEQQVCACQVQVGVPDREMAVRLTARVRVWLPVLLALSCSSPYFRGTDTGYASYRSIVLSRWPTAGPPDEFRSAREYDELVATLVHSGVISDPGMIYFDVRPSARYPTLEIRIADACPLLDDVVLLAALSRALVLASAMDEAAGEPVPRVPTVLLRAASWRAARSGLSGTLVDAPSGRTMPADELVRRFLDYLGPALRARQDDEVVAELAPALLARGNSASRQRQRVRSGADERQLLAAVLAETQST